MLSIVVPALNEESYLPFLLESIKKQEIGEEYEVIVADAGSEDKTAEIARAYSCQVITCGKFPARGRNEGARKTKGDLILFLDADIIIPSPYFLRDLLKEFRKRKLDIASFPIYPQGNIIDKLFYKLYNLWALIIQRFLAHAAEAILVKKEIHQKIGGFDERIKIGEDHFYVRKATKFSKFGFINIGSVLTSARRFEQDGRIKTYSKYVLTGIHMLFFGPVKSDIFNYRFDHYSKKK